MSKFVWGKVIEVFEYYFDGVKFEVVKYHPKKYVDGFAQRGQFSDDISYHSEELHASFGSMFEILIAWITYKQLGLNNDALARGIAKALDIA